MRTFCTPPPSLFDTDPLEISRFGVRLANENQTFYPMENQTACVIKRPMEIKQNWNQTTNEKSNPNSFRNAKRFRNDFGNTIKRPMEIKPKRNQTTNGKSNPNDFRNTKRFRNRFVNTIKHPMRNPYQTVSWNARRFGNRFENTIKNPMENKQKRNQTTSVKSNTNVSSIQSNTQWGINPKKRFQSLGVMRIMTKRKTSPHSALRCSSVALSVSFSFALFKCRIGQMLVHKDSKPLCL